MSPQLHSVGLAAVYLQDTLWDETNIEFFLAAYIHTGAVG